MFIDEANAAVLSGVDKREGKIRLVKGDDFPVILGGECGVLEFKARLSDQKIAIKCEHQSLDSDVPF